MSRSSGGAAPCSTRDATSARCRLVADSSCSVTDSVRMAVSDLAVFHPHVRGQRPLLIGRGLVRGIDLAIGDGDAAGFPIQIQRPLQLDAGLVVGPARLLLLRKRDATGSAGAPPASRAPCATSICVRAARSDGSRSSARAIASSSVSPPAGSI